MAFGVCWNITFCDPQTKESQVWNDMVNKWQHFNFRVNHPFKCPGKVPNNNWNEFSANTPMGNGPRVWLNRHSNPYRSFLIWWTFIGMTLSEEYRLIFTQSSTVNKFLTIWCADIFQAASSLPWRNISMIELILRCQGEVKLLPLNTGSQHITKRFQPRTTV